MIGSVAGISKIEFWCDGKLGDCVVGLVAVSNALLEVDSVEGICCGAGSMDGVTSLEREMEGEQGKSNWPSDELGRKTKDSPEEAVTLQEPCEMDLLFAGKCVSSKITLRER